MEFYQKLQKLRKENGMSQEELAGHLNVSRQAVSKWENGQGFPETDKLLAISNLFNISLDYLLKTETPTTEEGDEAEPGYYANREIVDGYLSFRRRGARQIALGVAVCILSIVFPIMAENSLGAVLMLLCVGIGVAILVACGFRPNRYTELENQPLVFDPTVLRQLDARYQVLRRRNGAMIVGGIFLFFVAIVLMVVFSEIRPLPENRYVFLFPLLVAAGVALIIMGTSSINAYNLFLHNDQHMQEVADGKKYGWLWGTTMPLAAMIFVGTGMVWDSWRIGWIVFPVFAILTAGIVGFLKARAQNKA